MHPLALDRCAEALGLDPFEVEELHDAAELLPALLASLILQRRPATASATKLADAILLGWGSAPFTAAGLIEWCEQGGPLRREVEIAAREVCCLSRDADLDARTLGSRLRELSKRGLVQCVAAKRGSALWAVDPWLAVHAPSAERP